MTTPVALATTRKLSDYIMTRLAGLALSDIVAPAVEPQKDDEILGIVGVDVQRYVTLARRLESELDQMYGEREVLIVTLKALQDNVREVLRGDIRVVATFVVELTNDPAKLRSLQESCQRFLQLDTAVSALADTRNELQSHVASKLRQQLRRKGEDLKNVAINRNWQIFTMPDRLPGKRRVECVYLV